MLQTLTSIEICAGAGGMALGLERAGFNHQAVFENDKHAHSTLMCNRPQWNPNLRDIRELDATPYKDIDLFSGGVPCPPFSIAGKQEGADDERDLFPSALRLIEEIKPRAIMLENVRGFAGKKFNSYRMALMEQLGGMGFSTDWKVLNACDYGVPQLRPRFILIALQHEYVPFFAWPEAIPNPPTVAETIGDLMMQGGWPGAKDWIQKAQAIAPTLVGGSKKHGGADLGPTRAKNKWKELGVDGKGIANTYPDLNDPPEYLPRLTIPMVARLQDFPDDWAFQGGKTAQYRQIGNALPPSVSQAIGTALANALTKVEVKQSSSQQLILWDMNAA